MRASTLYIIFFLLAPLSSLMAQGGTTLQLRSITDQQVYIAGEDIWMDLQVSGSMGAAKTIRIRLIDRNGKAKAQVEVVPTAQGSSAFLTIPENLGSDYYFIDAYARGIATQTTLVPVMIINPLLPPSACSFTSSPLNTSTVQSIAVQTDKNVYATREDVKVNVSGLSGLQQLNAVVIRKDRLSDLVEETASGRPMLLQHDANGDVEGEGHIITAKVMSGGKPLAGFKLTASLKGSRSSIATGITNADGMVKFILPIHYGQSTLAIMPFENKGQKPLVEIIEQLTTQKNIPFPCLALKEAMREDIEERLFNSRVTKRFYGDATKAYAIPDRDTSDFYGKPDERYLLDEYVRFPNMEEVIAEIIPPLRVKKDNGVQLLQVLNIYAKSFFENEPLILVDGIPHHNTKELLESDPLLVRSIDLVTRRYYIGETEFSGIVHFKTYRGDRALLRMSDNDLVTSFKGVQEVATVQSPVFTASNNRMPDNRNLLLKEQIVGANSSAIATLRFNTSDATGEYKVVIRGINSEGKETIASAVFVVK